jgi:hypothetical protein
MLRNELQVIEGWLLDYHSMTTENYSGTDVSEICQEVRAAWLNAVFSDMPDHSLRRYFNFHLEGITELSDTLFYFDDDRSDHQERKLRSQINEQLISLIVHLKKYHGQFFKADANTPVLWRTRSLKALAVFTIPLIHKVQKSAISAELKDVVIKYLREMLTVDKAAFCSFHALSYAEIFAKALCSAFSGHAVEESTLQAKLYELNFNRLEFFVYYQQQVRSSLVKIHGLSDKIQMLREEKQRLIVSSKPQPVVCQRGYDPINKIWQDWLDEQILLTGQERLLPFMHACKFSNEKIRLNLSVAHIACLIRLLVDENYLSTNSLSDVFKFVAMHFSSKKQEEISVGSLSKEYYSISQATAARVQGFLQKLVVKVNHNFFR